MILINSRRVTTNGVFTNEKQFFNERAVMNQYFTNLFFGYCVCCVQLFPAHRKFVLARFHLNLAQPMYVTTRQVSIKY